MRFSLLAWLPAETLLLLLAAAGIAMILGARGLAASLGFTAILLAILPAFLAPLFDVMPVWLLYAVMAFAVVAMFGAILKGMLGRGAWDHMVGSLAAMAVCYILVRAGRATVWIAVLPMKILAGLWKHR